jgi:ABC-type multidrug transport system ATPase subunit
MMVRVASNDTAAPAAPTGSGSGHSTDQEVAAHAAGDLIRIGRAADNDIVLNDLWVSLHHAEVRRTGDHFEVVDLGSTNGLSYNGQRVPRARLAPGDRISIGRHDFYFDGDCLHEYEDTGPVSVFADDITVEIKGQTLLDDLSFALRQGMLVGVIGPSGCGKSTMLRTVTGLRRANLGTVTYDGRDLYQNYHELRHRIGMVPQDDVVHRQLTVRTALRFAASLRFADDVPRHERHQRVDEVIDLLGLTSRAHQRIDTLSGGQRKRVSVALELLTEPSLLFLDEPTSGLDPALDKEVMQELRQQADGGRTVVVVTHSVLHLSLCDRVMVMCSGGRPGFFGPPDELLGFFDAEDYADVFVKVTNEPEVWSRRFRDSDAYRVYVSQVAAEAQTMTPAAQVLAAAIPAPAVVPGQAAPPSTEQLEQAESHEDAMPTASAPTGAAATPTSAAAANKHLPPPRTTNAGGLALIDRARHPLQPIVQFLTLCQRMLYVIASDRGYSLFLLGLPLALALLTHSVPGTRGLGPDHTYTLEAQRLLVVLIVGAAFLGVAVAIREIVSESTIYRRERAVGLSPGAYLASKLAVFGVIVTAQSVLFVWLSTLGRPGPAEALWWSAWPLGEVILPVALVAITSAVLGLLISALVKTVEQTTPVLVILVMGQLVLSGGLFELEGQTPLQQIAWLSPARWGYAADASSVDLLSKITFRDHLWAHTPGAYWRSIIVLGVQLVILVAAARLAMFRLEPNRGNN